MATTSPTVSPTMAAVPPMPTTPMTATTLPPSAMTQAPPPAASATATTTPARAHSPLPNQTGQSYLEERDEGLLRDVLEELDRERSKRAEMEAKLHRLEQEQAASKRAANIVAANAQEAPEYISLKATSEGYLELLDALTTDRPAFAAAVAYEKQLANEAASQSSARQIPLPKFKRQNRKGDQVAKTLPMHVIRLLEIIPWDARTEPHLFAQECVYEWQVRSSNKTWNKTLRQFPTFFKTLPIVVPQPGKTVEEKGHGLLNKSTWNRPPQQGVLTTMAVDQILNIDKGYPLPQNGGSWQWIGGWRIEKRVNQTDDQGWSYSYDPSISGDANHKAYGDRLEMPPKGTPNLIHRRRKWTRTRLLVDYPHASESTRQYLKVLADKAASQISAEKLSEQLVETKMKLTTLEQDHLNLQEVTDRRLRNLTKDLEKTQRMLKQKEELLDSFQKGDNGNVVKTKAKEQVKEFGSVVSQWVSHTVTKTRNRAMSTSSIPQQPPSSNDSAHDGNTVGSEEDRPESEDGAAAPSPTVITTTDSADTAASSSGVASAAAATIAENGNPKSPQQILPWEKVRGGGRQVLDKLKQTGDQSISKMKQRGRLSSLWTKTGSNVSADGSSPPS